MEQAPTVYKRVCCECGVCRRGASLHLACRCKSHAVLLAVFYTVSEPILDCPTNTQFPFSSVLLPPIVAYFRWHVVKRDAMHTGTHAILPRLSAAYATVAGCKIARNRSLITTLYSSSSSFFLFQRIPRKSLCISTAYSSL